MNELMGLPANILKAHYGSCDGKGNFSSRVDNVIVLSSAEFPMPALFEPSEDQPAVILKRSHCGEIIAVPADAEGRPLNKWDMFGGCFIYTSDSRFGFRNPIALFDRVETKR